MHIFYNAIQHSIKQQFYNDCHMSHCYNVLLRNPNTHSLIHVFCQRFLFHTLYHVASRTQRASGHSFWNCRQRYIFVIIFSRRILFDSQQNARHCPNPNPEDRHMLHECWQHRPRTKDSENKQGKGMKREKICVKLVLRLARTPADSSGRTSSGRPRCSPRHYGRAVPRPRGVRSRS